MRFRAFIAVDIEASKELRAFSDAIGRTGASLKLVNMDIIHITLKFLGDTDEELVPTLTEIMEEGVREMEPFEIRLNGAGAFPNLDRMSVVWAGIEGAEPSERLAEHIDAECSALGYRKEKRKFSPHVTVARVKGGRNKELLREAILQHELADFGAQKIERVVLKKSQLTPHGPIYTDIAEARL